jgi:hypothetical protein
MGENMNEPAIFSEFSGSAARFFGLRNWFIWLAVTFFCGTWLVLLLGHFAGANFYCVTIKPIVNGHNIESVDLIEGYLSQANHGLFYLIFAPISVCVAGLFLRSIEKSLSELRLQGRLDDAGYCWIANSNRKYFRITLWGLIAFLIIWNLQRELPTIRAAEDQTTLQMGYIQVFSLQKWTNQISCSKDEWSILEKLDDHGSIVGNLTQVFPSFSDSDKLPQSRSLTHG